MWFLRILTGNQSGQVFFLKNGINKIGRSESSSIRLKTPHISKNHAEIEISDKALYIKDLNSRNGTSVNGKKIKSHPLKHGDKILFHNILTDIMNPNPLSKENSSLKASQNRKNEELLESLNNPLEKSKEIPFDGSYENASQLKDEVQNELSHERNNEENFKSREEDQLTLDYHKKKKSQSFLNRYIDKGLMPGIYQLMSWISFKGVLALLTGIFILLFVFLSFIPLVRVFESRALEESKRRALTIARTLAQINNQAILNHLESTVSVSIAKREPGVLKALIISSKEGFIISPSFESHRYPKIPFLHSERKKNKETVKVIGGDKIVAFVPILDYNPELNIQAPKAHAVVLYSLKSIAVEKERILSFLIQTLFIAFLLGGGFFYILYKLTKHPIDQVNEQIDKALKEEGHNIEFPYLYPPMEKLVSNMNSALSRMSQNEGEVDQFDELQNNDQDRVQEMSHLVKLMGYAAGALLVPENKFGAANEELSSILNLNPQELDSLPLEDIRDQAFKSNLSDLLKRVKENPYEQAENEIEFSGINYRVIAQPLLRGKNISYVLIVLWPYEESKMDEAIEEESA